MAAILNDICNDVRTAHDYYYGDDKTPGKTDEFPGVKS